MQTIETDDPIEAQKCRRAQYSGNPAEVTVKGSKIFGMVRSVKQEPGPLWIVTVIPTELPKVFPLRPYRPAHQ